MTKYALGVKKNFGVYAALQQTYFFAFSSPSNTMLGGGDQNIMDVKSCGVDAASQQTLLLSPAPHSKEC